MDENSGRTKKTRTGAPLPGLARRAAAPRRDGKPTWPVLQASADDPSSKSERVIETRARPRTPDVKDHIGRQLKAVYDDLLRQPVPSRFMDLLHELDSKSGSEDK